LLDICESMYPSNNMEWKNVAAKYNKESDDSVIRNDINLRKKFTDMARTKMPTGDPHMPDEIQRSKKIYQEIIRKSQCKVLSRNGVDLLTTTENDDLSPSSDQVVSGINDMNEQLNQRAKLAPKNKQMI
jgi:hypothetical protein